MKKLALLMLPLLTGASLFPIVFAHETQSPLQLGMGCMLARWAFTNNGVLPLDLYRQYLGDISSACAVGGTTVSSSDIQITDNSGNLLQRDQSGALIVSNLTGSTLIGSTLTGNTSVISVSGSTLSATTQTIIGGFSLYIDGELDDTTDKALAISKNIYDASIEYGDIDLYKNGVNMLGIKDIRSRLTGMQIGQKRIIQLSQSDFLDPETAEGQYIVEISVTSFR